MKRYVFSCKVRKLSGLVKSSPTDRRKRFVDGVEEWAKQARLLINYEPKDITLLINFTSVPSFRLSSTATTTYRWRDRSLIVAKN
jgi:hypothetical protein